MTQILPFKWEALRYQNFRRKRYDGTYKVPPDEVRNSITRMSSDEGSNARAAEVR